jgi:hypothetical protein
MRALRHAVLLVGAWFALTGTAAAGALDDIYDDTDLTSLAAAYQRGWNDNFENVFKPVLTADERARLGNVDFRIDLRVPDNEPFAFMAGGNTVIVSAASIRFLEDIVMAYTWLDTQGLSTQAVADYLLMLRYWDPARGRPPKPWDVLCVPENAFDLEPYGERARRVFNSAVVFALLHEYGHVFHGHPGNRAVAPEESRKNESEADRFALDMFARVGDVPLGVTILFFTMAHLHENQADFASDDLYRESLAARTHPVSPERVDKLSLYLSNNAQTFGQGLGGSAAAMAVAIEVSQFSLLLGDRDIHQLSQWIGRSAEPQHLGPRARGRHLGLPCDAPAPGGQSFDGLFHGEITDGNTGLDVDTVLSRDGDRVTGSYSYGAGYGDIDGVVDGETLSYRWRLLSNEGAATLTYAGDGVYRGNWGVGNASTGGGDIRIRAE